MTSSGRSSDDAYDIAPLRRPFALLLRKWQEATQLSNNAIARAMAGGIGDGDPKGVSQWLSGHRMLQKERVPQLAAVFGKPAAPLVRAWSAQQLYLLEETFGVPIGSEIASTIALIQDKLTNILGELPQVLVRPVDDGRTISEHLAEIGRGLESLAEMFPPKHDPWDLADSPLPVEGEDWIGWMQDMGLITWQKATELRACHAQKQVDDLSVINLDTLIMAVSQRMGVPPDLAHQSLTLLAQASNKRPTSD